jgi:hypothetical protein
MALVDVVLVETGFSTGMVVAVGLVDVAFFGANPEGGGLVGGEVEGGNGDFVGFGVSWVTKIEGFLSYIRKTDAKQRGRKIANRTSVDGSAQDGGKRSGWQEGSLKEADE